MMKIRNTKDRVTDVATLFSMLFSIPLFGIILRVWGFLFEKQIIYTRPPLSFLSVLAFILAFVAIYFMDQYFTKNDRYITILDYYGKVPNNKDLIIGLLFFLFCSSILITVALLSLLFMKLTH